MLELNKWFFVQLANFLLLIVLLNIILFKPLLRLFKEREENTSGALEKATVLNKEKDDIVVRIDSKLLDTRNRARATFETYTEEGLDVQRKALDEARHEAAKINKKATEDLNLAVEKARTGLRSDVEAISKQIVEKLIG